MLRARLVLLSAVACAAAIPVAAQPVGGEFLINTYTTGRQYQYGHAVAADPSGSFVVVWDNGFSPFYGGTPDILGQRFDPTGSPVGPEFSVNTFTTGAQARVVVAKAASGAFLVVWDSFGQDGDEEGVFAQLYDAGGVAQGSEIAVNEFTPNHQGRAAVSLDGSGNFVVAYSSVGADGDGYSIAARRIDTTGAFIGSEFVVNSYTTGPQYTAALAPDAGGGFLVLWSGRGTGDNFGIFGRRFDSGGAPIGGDFIVNGSTANQQYGPAVATSATGEFIVAWTGGSDISPDGNQDGSFAGIFARRLDVNGDPIGGQFLANSYTTNHQLRPAVGMDATGAFVVSWMSGRYANVTGAPLPDGQDGSYGGIFAQRYFPDATPLGSEFLVNTQTISAQRAPAIAASGNGQFVVVWNSFYQDGSSFAVMGQMAEFDTLVRQLFVDDPAPVSEGAGSVTFNVTLSPPAIAPVTVHFGTANGSAKALPGDFIALAGTLTFNTGEFSKPVTVTIGNDALDEFDENFFLRLDTPSANATIADGEGVATILDDDAEPVVSIADAVVLEADSGNRTISFTLSLSAPSAKSVKVTAATALDTGGANPASAPSDFAQKTQIRTFSPGSTSETFIVSTKGDVLVEPNETFLVNLSALVNTTPGDVQAVGTILNND